MLLCNKDYIWQFWLLPVHDQFSYQAALPSHALQLTLVLIGDTEVAWTMSEKAFCKYKSFTKSNPGLKIQGHHEIPS